MATATMKIFAVSRKFKIWGVIFYPKSRFWGISVFITGIAKTIIYLYNYIPLNIFNINDNPKINVLMLENIRQKKLFFAWYFPILRRYFLDYHITKMFILKALLSKSGPQILICRPRVSFVPVAKRMAQKTLKCGKSKSQGLKWQQCPQNYYFCLISYDYTNVGHYAICNREKMKTL